MKIIVTHVSPDWDAIGSVWILKKFLPGWQDAEIKFVPAGQRLQMSSSRKRGSEIPDPDFAKGYGRARQVGNDSTKNPIEKIGGDEVIHVDTGLGPLDHHQTSDDRISAASLCWDFVQKDLENAGSDFTPDHKEAVDRIVKVIVADDHFKEVFWGEPTADYHEFSLFGVLDGIKLEKPDQDDYYVEFGINSLNALIHTFLNKIWAEHEIEKNSIEFLTKKYGKGIAFETINDSVIKLAQKMGYLLVVRKDPRKGYIRIKVRPKSGSKDDIDLTHAYEQFKKIDPSATWFLHVSKKMLLNGTPKNPDMIPTKLSLQEIINVIQNTY